MKKTTLAILSGLMITALLACEQTPEEPIIPDDSSDPYSTDFLENGLKELDLTP